MVPTILNGLLTDDIIYVYAGYSYDLIKLGKKKLENITHSLQHIRLSHINLVRKLLRKNVNYSAYVGHHVKWRKVPP